MKLIFKQRLFSWFDSYDIYDESGAVVFSVKGQLSWGHKFAVYDSWGDEVGTVVQRVLTWLPKFEIYDHGNYLGSISKELTFFTPKYNIDYNGWRITGNILEWEYNIIDSRGYPVAYISKELFHLTDTYVIDVPNPDNVLDALLFVLAIDAEKCSRN